MAVYANEEGSVKDLTEYAAIDHTHSQYAPYSHSHSGLITSITTGVIAPGDGAVYVSGKFIVEITTNGQGQISSINVESGTINKGAISPHKIYYIVFK